MNLLKFLNLLNIKNFIIKIKKKKTSWPIHSYLCGTNQTCLALKIRDRSIRLVFYRQNTDQI